MSSTEYHFGKVRILENPDNLSIEERFKEICLARNILEPDEGTWKDTFFCTTGEWESYIVVKDRIFEVFDHHSTNDYDDLFILSENPDGSHTFVTNFYNGGTCLSEVLEEELQKIK